MNLSELAYQEKRKMEMLQAKMRGLRIGDDGNMLIGKRRSNGGMEFYIKRKGSGQRKYIDRESQEIIPMLLRDRFATESLKILERNDKALAAFMAAAVCETRASLFDLRQSARDCPSVLYFSYSLLSANLEESLYG